MIQVMWCEPEEPEMAPLTEEELDALIEVIDRQVGEES